MKPRQAFPTILLVLVIAFQAAGRNPRMAKPLVKEEFRGIWIATVNNTDWPSKPGLPADQQQKELINLIDRIENTGLNAVILQVRPAADAIYPSSTEPWSYYLTGEQGKAPTPYYDPLRFAINLCHQRGLEFHAWFNPFRVRNHSYDQLAPNHPLRKNSNWIVDYNGKSYLDPGIPEVREYVINVIMDVVRRYDIDAVHLDDYFYPYPVKTMAFPDEATFKKYGGDDYPDKMKEWRRNNVNLFISELNKRIKAEKSWVKLGVSPFGVWRNLSLDPKGSAGKRGLSSYDDLYADARTWIKNGWVDYLIPQLYWERGNAYGDFDTLARWWNKNVDTRHLYFGQALYKATSSAPGWKDPTEIEKQIDIGRQMNNARGFAFFSASHLLDLTKEQVSRLRQELKEEPAIIPKMNWLDSIPPPVPGNFRLESTINGTWLKWKLPANYNDDRVQYVIYRVKKDADGNNQMTDVFKVTDKRQLFIPPSMRNKLADECFRVSTIDRLNNESALSPLIQINGTEFKLMQ